MASKSRDNQLYGFFFWQNKCLVEPLCPLSIDDFSDLLMEKMSLAGHSLQLYGFSPEWVLWCFFRLPSPGNIVGHCSLENGDFSGYKLPKMSLDILYKNMAHLHNEFSDDFIGYLLMKMSRDIFYKNNTSLPNKMLNELSDVLLEEMSLGVLYMNMVSPWMCSLVYLQKTSWEYLLRFTISLGVIAIYHMVYFVAKFALGVGGAVRSN